LLIWGFQKEYHYLWGPVLAVIHWTATPFNGQNQSTERTRLSSKLMMDRTGANKTIGSMKAKQQQHSTKLNVATGKKKSDN